MHVAVQLPTVTGPVRGLLACELCRRLEPEPKQFKVCGRCKAARYCSLECQRRDWKNTHALWCGRTEREVYEFFGVPELWETVNRHRQESSSSGSRGGSSRGGGGSSSSSSSTTTTTTTE